MTKKPKYYRTKADAESERKSGDRIYYEAGMGWYIVKVRKRSFWDVF